MNRLSQSSTIDQLVNVLTANLSAADIKTAIVTSDISFRITKERIDRQMTQKEFAEYMGVTQAMVSKWESGDYNFTIGSLSKIFDKLNMDFDITINKPSENNSTFLSYTLESNTDYTESNLTQLYCCAS